MGGDYKCILHICWLTRFDTLQLLQPGLWLLSAGAAPHQHPML